MTDAKERDGLLSYFGPKADQVAVDGKLLVPYRTRQIYQHTCEFRPDSNGEDENYVPPKQIGFTEVYDRLTDKLIGIIDGADQLIRGQKNAAGEFVCKAINPKTQKEEIQTFPLADTILTDIDHTPGIREVSYMFTENWTPYGTPTEKEITPVLPLLEERIRKKRADELWEEKKMRQITRALIGKMPQRTHE